MTPRLQLHALDQRYGEREVLRAIDLRLMPGEFVGLIGPNGSGKTTLMRSIGGLLPTRAGQIAIDGIDLRRDVVAAKTRLGYAVDPVALPDALTGRQVLELFASARALPGIAPSLRVLADALRFTRWLDEPVAAYSLGTRQKLAVLCGLIGDPPLLLLDEPLNGLDPLSAYELKRELARRVTEDGATVLLATHALDVAERFITRALLLHEGQIVRDWSGEALAQVTVTPGGLELAMVEALREVA